MSAEDVSEIKSKSGNSRLRQERERRGWTQSEVAERVRTTRVNVVRWENGQTFPGPYYRQKLAELYGKSLQELDLIPEGSEERNEESPPIWNVPYRRNPFFTGREEILFHLYTILRDRKPTASAQALALSGLGGIGKTQIAVEYAYRCRDHYQAIFWLDASTREALNSHFLTLAVLLDLPEQHEYEQDIAIQAVKRWLRVHNQWLLILDNVESLEAILDLLPTDITGDVLLTTRLHSLGTIAEIVEVEKMELDEGVLFLLRRIKAIESRESTNHGTDRNTSQAIEIVTEMDGLPLALDQAATYIEETHCGLTQYLNLFATRRKELLLRRGRLPIDHPDSVTTTWSLSFQQVEQENAASADLLQLFAFLDPEAIPEEIIHLGADNLGPTLRTVAKDPLQVDNSIELLLRYSLIQRTPKDNSLSIHRLVQAVLIDGMDTTTRRVWAERTIHAVIIAFSNAESQNWQRYQRFLPHILMCVKHMEAYGITFPEATQLLNETVSYLIAHGSFDQSELLLLRVLAIRQDIWETDDPDKASTLNDLGHIYHNQGKYQQAEQLLQQALAIRQQILGEEHRDVADTLYYLAGSYRAQGNYVEAEPLYLRALHIRKITLGPDHPLVAKSFYGLAKLYSSQENYQQAEAFCIQALHIQEQSLGSSHPELASTLNVLAKIYLGQRKLDEAKELERRALGIREDFSGPNHPHIATILNGLVEIFHATGKYREAEPLIARAIKIQEDSFGSKHPYMAYSLINRGENFFLQGKYLQAESDFKQALYIREQNLRAEHPRIGTIYFDLAKLYTATQRFEEAESFYQKALSLRERAKDKYN